jgi:hypothetical protein
LLPGDGFRQWRQRRVDPRRPRDGPAHRFTNSIQEPKYPQRINALAASTRSLKLRNLAADQNAKARQFIRGRALLTRQNSNQGSKQK